MWRLLTFGAHFAEVAVDTRTGKVEVLRLVAAHDVGRAINRLGCENQIQGGAIMGMGFGLMERQYIDSQTGICRQSEHGRFQDSLDP